MSIEGPFRTIEGLDASLAAASMPMADRREDLRARDFSQARWIYRTP